MKFCQLKLTNEADDLSVFAKAIDLHQQNNRKIKLHAIKHVFQKKALPLQCNKTNEGT